RPILLLAPSVNQSAQSGPGVTPSGWPGTGNSSKVPGDPSVGAGRWRRAILFTSFSANQMLPSGPVVIPSRLTLCDGAEYSVTTPVTVICAILLVARSQYQNAPSGPAVISRGAVPGLPAAKYSVKTWPVTTVGRLRE